MCFGSYGIVIDVGVRRDLLFCVKVGDLNLVLI